jgi:FkbM family methyltransferase
MKRLLKKTLNKFGFDIKRINSKIKQVKFDDLLKDKICKNPVIFDVGANKGQTIKKYLNIFNQPTIHSFEPLKNDFNYMYNEFKNNKNIFLNNFALGDKNEEKNFNIMAKTENSSFNKINHGTDWLKKRSKEYKTTENGYITEIQKVKIKKLDDYVKINNIDKIDLLKIDTQGYEDRVLEGSKNSIKDNKIKIILTEIMFDNVYDKHFSFSDIEKFILPYNFRMVGIDLPINNIFTYTSFGADVYYFNKNYYNI